MGECIYGIDPDGEVTSVMVRDAIVQCFYDVHKGLLIDKIQVSEDKKETFTKAAVISIVKEIFKKYNKDFNNPIKETLILVCDELAKLAKQFRSEDVIKRNYQNIMRLINKIS